jgi:hypothetical protein
MLSVAEFQYNAEDEYWVWNRTVVTPLGNMSLDLRSDHDPAQPPAEELLRRATELVRYVEANGDYIRDVVFGVYRAVVEDNPGWLDIHKIPRDVTRDRIINYIETPGLMVVHSKPSRFGISRGEVETFECTINMGVPWDEEHGLTLDFDRGRIVSISSGGWFELKDGVVRYLDDDPQPPPTIPPSAGDYAKIRRAFRVLQLVLRHTKNLMRVAFIVAVILCITWKWYFAVLTFPLAFVILLLVSRWSHCPGCGVIWSTQEVEKKVCHHCRLDIRAALRE